MGHTANPVTDHNFVTYKLLKSMEKVTLSLPDYSQFELLTEAVEFAASNALETKQREDYARLRAELETSINPLTFQQ